jgi:hypothetical protein
MAGMFVSRCLKSRNASAVLSVFLNTEKVIVTFVSLSFDRMSSETAWPIDGHCARDNM